jgi:class I fructose-bisphosphate aldolase
MTLIDTIEETLGEQADSLLKFNSPRVDKAQLKVPGPDWVNRIFALSDRPTPTLRSLQALFDHGRLRGTGIFPFLPWTRDRALCGSVVRAEPRIFRSGNIVQFALEGGCNAVASTFGVLGSVAAKYAHRIPFIVKFNHNEFLTYPNKFDQIFFGTIKQAWDMGAWRWARPSISAPARSGRQIVEVSQAFKMAHDLGMATILWCYLRNRHSKRIRTIISPPTSTGQANHLGVTLEADIIKQKLPMNTGGYKAISSKENPYGKTSDKVYTELSSEHPIDLCRYQVLNNYTGRMGLINSGGESKGASDLADAVATAVINKRAGGIGLISGRKAFQRSRQEGIKLLNAIQDVYLCKEVTVA